MRRLLTLTILGSWIIMVALLVRRQAPLPSTDVTALPGAALQEHEEWYGVYRNTEKIGHAHRVSARTLGGYAFYDDMVVSLTMLGAPQQVRTALVAETDDAFALERFRFTLISPATVFTARGTVEKGNLGIVYGPEGQTAHMDLPLTDAIYLPSTLRSRVLAGDVAAGTRYSVPVFSPLTMRNEPMTLIVEGPEPLTSDGTPVATIRIAEEYAGIRTHAWLEPSGAVVREEAALGFVLERETRERALTEATATTPVDLVGVSRIPLEGEIPDPRGATRLSLRVTGAARDHVLNDPPRQRTTDGRVDIAREDIPAGAAADDAPPAAGEYTAPAPFIESDDPAIVARARAIVGDTTDHAAAARRLVTWVASHLEKVPSVTVPSAREVLTSMRGDCNEHAVLLTALARAAGIPARVVAGAVYANDGFYYHAWSELWLGRWVSADAVFDQMPTDATHVKLVEGGPERHIALAGTIGQLAFRVEEVR
jgi:hypothetical protein